MRQRWLAVAIAVIAGLAPLAQAHALVFGPIRVDSYLNQPLDARIPLTALSSDQLGALDVRIAPAALFKRFHIERSADVGRLQIDISKTGTKGRAIVHIRTRKPFREPFVDFLLAADTGDGQMLREYTILLDPPPATGNAHDSQMVAARPAPALSAAARHPGRYGPVQAGDTLWQIAKQTRPAGATIAQMAVAIYQANPGAFAGNINMLRRGAVLAIPDAAAAARQQLTASAAPAVNPETQEKTLAFAVASNEKAAAAPAVAVMKTPSDGAAESAQASMATPALTTAASTPATVQPEHSAPAMPDNKASSTSEPPPEKAATDASPHTAAGNSISASKQATGSAHEKPAGKPAEDPGLPVLADADASPVTGTAYDVSGAGEVGPLSWQSLWYLALLVALVALGAVWLRRRQYKPVPLDSDAVMEAPPPPAADAEPEVQAASARAVSEDDRETPDGASMTAIAAAEAHLQSGDFSAAREPLEEALADTPHDPALQDKLFEVDYLAGDAARFSTDVERFSADLQASGSRRAGIAAMGRILLPGDARFETQAATSPHHDAEAASPMAPAEEPNPDDPPTGGAASYPPEAAVSAHEDDKPVATHSDQSAGPRAADIMAMQTAFELPPDQTAATSVAAVDDDRQYRDAESTEPGDYQWEPIDIDTEVQREHDLGADPGLAFELDSENAGDTWQRVNESADDEVGASADSGGERPELIDAEAFDLDMDEQTQDQDGALAADTVEIRLDLARMYLDMEDAHTARSLLEEVIANGDSAQRETARTLLEQAG